MKKSSKGASKGSLKKIKEEIELCFASLEYEKAEPYCKKFIDLSPKNAYGYVSYIKALTNNYNKYLEQEKLKDVRKIYDDAYALSSKNEKVILKKTFDDYLYDLKEVDNLRKIKKDLISKEFIKNIYNGSMAYINQNLNLALTYNKDGTKVKNIYDLINGLFYFSLLIFNIFNPNYLLILTVLFGIFGIITIYSFIEMNFFKKGKYRLQKDIYQKIIDDSNEKIFNIKQKIKELEESIAFLKEQKTTSKIKIPELFLNDINDLITNDEKQQADKIYDSFVLGDVVKFSFLLENNTNLNVDEVTDLLKEINDKDDELSKYVNGKIKEKKSNQNEALLMKKVSKFNIFALVITLIISIFSIIVLVNNFQEINFWAFIISIIVGIISMFIYNINTGKHAKFTDTFNDNLISTIFNSTMVYDLIYFKITGGLVLSYGFLKIPIILIFVLIGFVMLVSLIKYEHLVKKLRS